LQCLPTVFLILFCFFCWPFVSFARLVCPFIAAASEYLPFLYGSASEGMFLHHIKLLRKAL
jgi:hypothetical protein